ncbi:TonB-dependent receptor [Mucilaginibacter sp. HMF5004]|uniref:SusC/RagA family TonB-linked outer membrane protein n=1 Tax=Mucilaginibacter rivuli TaxID=2857527 RepID=UPI001C5E4707|nr:TonB-dependent receptor [Mucilaginibacter rivuli]MBW4889434.1 TonB-dependent receptor [Mucilaginibacter rivuli]
MRLNLQLKKRQWTSLLLFLLFVFQLSTNSFAQSGNITGVVVDNKGETIPGVTVKVKGKTEAASTDVKGAFSIAAKAGDVLVFSSVGFTAKEVVVTTQSKYKVELTDANTSLKELVVVGYGTSTRKTLSSSITTVKPEDLNKGAIADIGQLLQGKVAGLNITASGDPNKPAAVIMRGASTINSPGAPFYVIDGIPGADITAVAPADIASIDVLKDAAATAIYGNRASSGVIMVTTKRGKKGQSQVAYSGYVAMEKVSNKLDLMNADQLRSYVTSNGSSFSSVDDINPGKINTDWMAAIERSTGFSHNHNLSLTGGGEHSTYSASLNYLSKQGILAASSLERVIGRLNLDQYALNDKIKFSLSLANSSSTANNEPLQNVVLLQAAKRLPISPITNADGSYFENTGRLSTGYYNPLALVANAQDQTKYTVTMAAFNTQIKLPLSLTYNVNLSYQKTSALHGEYYGSYFFPLSTGFYNNPDPGIGISHSLVTFPQNGSAIRSEYENTAKTLETFLSWNKSFGDHSLTAVLGYSYLDNIYGDGLTSSSANFPNDNIGFQNLSLGSPYALASYRINVGADRTYGETLLISDFFRLNYNYKDKYLFQGSIRKDGSSVFGDNNHWGYFPSIGVAWRIGEEDFMKNQSLFSDLKLRASYGKTGNSAGIDAYTAKLVYVSAGTYYNNGLQVGAYAPGQGANPDLKWETTATSNIGVDFAILKGKVSGSVDVYNKTTDGMLFYYSVSPTLVPGGHIWANSGSINNKGIEFSLTANAISKKDFNWSSSLNLAYNKNVINSLQGTYGNSDMTLYSDPEGPGLTNATVQVLKEGMPLGQFYSFKYAGKDPSTGKSLFYKADGTTTTQPAIKADYFFLGSPQPSVLMGWSNNFNYKQFDLSFFLRGSFGGKIMNATRADLSYVANANNNNILNSASGDKMSDGSNNFYSDRYLENGSYVRLDNATLGYTIKNPFTNVSNIRMYFTANNVFTITGYKGIDPEINQGGASPGVDYNNFYPKTRTLLLGFNISF